MAQLPHVPTVIIGHFNNVLNEELNRQSNKKSNGRGKATRWASRIQEMGLSDIWRVRFPVSKEYSCYSSTYGSLSRIDMALGNGHFSPISENNSVRSKGNLGPLSINCDFGVDRTPDPANVESQSTVAILDPRESSNKTTANGLFWR